MQELIERIKAAIENGGNLEPIVVDLTANVRYRLDQPRFRLREFLAAIQESHTPMPYRPRKFMAYREVGIRRIDVR